jgi:hypothetical protein
MHRGCPPESRVAYTRLKRNQGQEGGTSLNTMSSARLRIRAGSE